MNGSDKIINSKKTKISKTKTKKTKQEKNKIRQGSSDDLNKINNEQFRLKIINFRKTQISKKH